MIDPREIQELVRQWGLTDQVIEKDYVLGWILWGIGTEPILQDTWAFKGGTCLKKCYIETFRFSEDLDFTVMENGPLRPDELSPLFETLLDRVHQESGIDFQVQAPLFKQRGEWPYTEGRIYYRGPRAAQIQRIKLDLLASEAVVRPTVLRPIAHPYSDGVPSMGSVRAYCFEEVFAEKIRALGERSRARDLYDVINLYRRRDLRRHNELIQNVLADKCQTKGVDLPTLEAIADSPNRAELEAEWANMLDHQLPILPPFAHYWEELPNVFIWLAGEEATQALEPWPMGQDEDESWSPSAAEWYWVDAPLEVIRFAAANHLCLGLGYGGSTREIEPYSLRKTRAGDILLHSIRTDSREHRAYRIDRIESMQVTNKPFRPEYDIEFLHAGPIETPQQTRRGQSWSVRSNQNRGYTVQCPRCQRTFHRTKSSLALRAHKDENGYPCPGRRGHRI
jgi:predicted nucleotidyltransferase component of viral defense system